MKDQLLSIGLHIAKRFANQEDIALRAAILIHVAQCYFSGWFNDTNTVKLPHDYSPMYENESKCWYIYSVRKQ